LDGDSIVADGFDYIEYPKLLTQPDADAPQLVKEALEQFLSRNSVKGDKVAISVSGESGLARYFKPPPVDVKKIADIVKYEAKQQIPFALEDVIWDYQRMAGGQEVDGFALDTEIGLFAMKREQVQKALGPFNKAEIEVDYIQLTPIAIYNYVGYDVTKDLPEGEEYNAEAPPASIIVLSIGTDTTDLVVTNGYRVWQRNIPLGGNHFTKQLSKDLKLTFAKAEHLKRNPKQAEDPKAVFQAMRPVFADMVTEVQRSIGFFQSLDRKAKIDSVVMLGNTVKLPGLVQYLSKHLGYEVREIESFKRLSGSSVVTSPSFKDNLMAFGACYGLCLQGLNRGKLSTNLLPRELLTERMIRAKKPWAIAGVGALVLACALNYVAYSVVLNQVHQDKKENGVSWKDAIDQATQVSSYSGGHISKDSEQMAQLDLLQKIGQEVVGASDRRVLWLEVMRAINTSLPPMAPNLPPNVIPDHKKLPFTDRQDLKVEYVESQFYPDLAVWFNNDVKTKWLQINSQAIASPGVAGASTTPAPAAVPAAVPAAAPAAAPVAAPTSAGSMMPGDGYGTTAAAPTTDVSGVTIDKPPTGPGWVFEIKGYHFYNSSDSAKRRFTGAAHVRDTLIRNLEHGWVEVPLGPNQPSARFTMKELGIGFAILARDPPIKPNFPIQNPNYTPPVSAQGSGIGGETGLGAAGFSGSGIPGSNAAVKEDPNNPQYFFVPRYDFIVQFCWVETPLNVRIANMRKAELERKAAAEAAAAAAAAAPPADPAQAPVAPPTVTGPATTPPATVPPVSAPPAAGPGVPPVTPVDPAAASTPMPMVPAPMVPAPMVPAPMVPAPVVPDAAEVPATAPAVAPAVPDVPM
jgi:type IV pilus assembly protein PilM